MTSVGPFVLPVTCIVQGRPVTTLKVPLQAILHEGFQDSGLDYRPVMDVMPSYLGGRDEENLIYSQPIPHESVDSWRGVVAILFV